MASKRKSKVKKGRSPSIAVKVRELETDLTALKRRVSELENVNTEPKHVTQLDFQPELGQPKTS